MQVKKFLDQYKSQLKNKKNLLTNQYSIKLYTKVKTLNKGECFGELAILSNYKRAARIVCTKNCFFGYLNRYDYDRIISRIHQKMLNDKILFMSKISIFKNLSIAKKYKFSHSLTEIQTFKKGKQLFAGKNEPKGIYLIKEGKFEIKLKQNV